MSKTVYICYFGLREPLVQTQVLPYLREIIKDGIEASLLTFEPAFKTSWTPEQLDHETRDLAEQGIKWNCLPYHKRISALATAYDVFRGALFLWGTIRREKIDVLHGRVHVPTLMGAIARKFSKRKPKLLFDIRGFFPEEYTDAGIWTEGGLLYRAAKQIEKWLMKEADGFVVLTEKARQILFPESAETGFDKLRRPIEVIPCCVDLEKFKTDNERSRREVQTELEIGKRKVIAYVGSFGGWYMTEEMLDFFLIAHEKYPKTFFLILTQRDQEKVRENLLARGFNETDFFVGSVPSDEIPRYLCAADVAVSFIKACYSKLASSPTKIAEYLACGLPVISNSGVGDVDELITDNGVGVLIGDFSRESYLAALAAIETLGDVSDKCRETAVREFDLRNVGGYRYKRLYNKLLTENK